MKILQVNKFNYLRGGAEKYFLELSEQLVSDGYQVAKFCMQDSRNLEDDWSKYWLSNISFEQPGWQDRLRAPERIIYSRFAKKKLKQLINDFQPDIIHAHNIYHQLSPSILDAARQSGVPVVMTLHDYKLICPNYQMLNHGQVCEKCLDGNFWHCFSEKCFKDSRTQSFLASCEAVVHQQRQTYQRAVNLFLAPSQFMADQCQIAGWSADKFKVVINPVPQLPSGQRQASDYFLYVGRLSAEKGLAVLLSAIAQSNKFKLKIAGQGPLQDNLKQLAQDLKITDRVEFLGQQNHQQLAQLLDQAISLVIPSVWYENMPLSMLESLERGCPVIASQIGGLPEIVKPGINGWLAQPGNVDSLTKMLGQASQADHAVVGQQARDSVAQYNWSNHLAVIKNIYQQVIKQHNV